VAQRAVDRLLKSLDKQAVSLITTRACEDLTSSLTRDLSVIARQALLQEFQIFRSSTNNSRLALFAKITNSANSDLYHEFSQNIKRDGGLDLYWKYPVLARLLSLRVHQWLENSRAFIIAYQKDRYQAGLALGLGRLGAITGIVGGLSDPHNGGKNVLIVTTEDDKKLVYKPRPVSLDSGLMRIFAYLNKQSESALFREIKTFGRKKHGWCEHIHHSTTESLNELSEYYFRLGALLAALHVFRATDCHSENLIASENYPVMVDLETLFHCNYDMFEGGGNDHAEESPLNASVNRIGLLPTAKDTEDDLDLSPLGIRLTDQMASSYQFENLGTVLMGLKVIREPVDPALSQPSKDSIDYRTVISQVKAGFEHAYGLIQRNALEITKQPSLLPSLRTASCRFVARPTAAYYWLRQRSLHPDSLQHGIDHSLTFTRVLRSWAQAGYRADWFAIAEQEISSLENHDIPYFTVRLGHRNLYCNGRPIANNAFRESPWMLVKRRLLALSSQDCANQLQVIDFSFAQQGVCDPEKATPRQRASGGNRLLNTVYDICTQVRNSSLGARNPSQNWLGLIPAAQDGLYRMGLVGHGLYKGAAGIGLLYAASYAVDGDDEFKRLASNILHGIVTEPKSNIASVLDLGDGIAGLAYALVRGGLLLKDPELIAHAAHLAHSMTDDSIISGGCDLLGGTAGIILSLDVINRAMPSHELARKIRLAGERLIRDATEHSPTCWGWKTLDDKQLPGFAHGIGGISYALVRAGRALKYERFFRAAELGQVGARQFFSESEGNWNDPRSADGQQPLNSSWCHGTVGIALSAIDEIGKPPAGRELNAVKRSIELMIREEPAAHNICCGITGALELTIRTQHDAPLATLHGQILDLLSSTPNLGFKPLHSSTPFISGLFDGAAGIGYQLLRAIAPRKIPSILNFD
jgi:type 2 lantibiotic biosynthesis protein LanM